MKLPLILDYVGDVEIFEDLRAAEAFLEPYDVEDGRVIVYDSDGGQVMVKIEPRLWGGRRTKLDDAKLSYGHVDDLREILMNMIAAVIGASDVMEQMSLEELVRKAREVMSVKKQVTR